MDNNFYIAIIKWNPSARKSGIPFKNNKYAPLLEIGTEKVFNGSSWSIICYSYKFIDELTTLSKMCFLNKEAAPNVLNVGVSFNLYEGNTKVATGKIIDVTLNMGDNISEW